MAENTLLVYNQRVACKELLFETGFAEGWEQDFEIPRGSWKAENGVLTGEYLEEARSDLHAPSVSRRHSPRIFTQG